MNNNSFIHRITAVLVFMAAASAVQAEEVDSSKQDYLAEARASIEAQGREALLDLENDIKGAGRPGLSPLVRNESLARADSEDSEASDEERG